MSPQSLRHDEGNASHPSIHLRILKHLRIFVTAAKNAGFTPFDPSADTETLCKDLQHFVFNRFTPFDPSADTETTC